MLYVNERQRLAPEELRALRQRARLVEVVTLGGVDYVEIYDQRPSSSPVSVSGLCAAISI